MDDIKERLSAASEECLNRYTTWEASKKDAQAREALQEAIHELRKVASRFEIDIAISEREESSKRHIPIPAHRSKRTHVESGPEADGQGGGDAAPVEKVRKPRRRKPRAAGGEE